MTQSMIVINKSYTAFLNGLAQPLVAGGLGLGLLALAYTFGLSGAFLLDDYGTLPSLNQWGDLNSFDKLAQYLGGGFAGPTGRPVALFSFALHAGQWPDEPYYFLLVNLVIHLANVGLLWLLFNKLASSCGWQGNLKQWLPLCVALFWGLHALHVSSVLYVVQRMVLLSAFFTFACLLVYLSSREASLAGRQIKSLLLLSLSFIFALFALCSKENAVLIPIQLLLLELLLKWENGRGRTQLFRWVFYLGIIFPVFVLLVYLSKHLGDHLFTYITTGVEPVTRRPFTMSERLFTEMRVLGDYLLAILLPRIQGAGLFHDNYELSKGFFHPHTTALWFLVHLGLVAGSIIWRRKIPIIAFGVLWFYGNHLIESTVILLEIKFEHRNYLPSIGIIFAVIGVFLKIKISHKARSAFTLVALAVFWTTLALRSNLWGQPEKAAMVWVAENPRSIRALENAALLVSKKPKSEPQVSALLLAAIALSQDDPIMNLKYFSYACSFNPGLKLHTDALVPALASAEINWQLVAIFESIFDKLEAGQCNQLPIQEYRRLLATIEANTKYQTTSIPLSMRDLEARSELLMGDAKKAVEMYLALNYKSINLGFVMRQALWLANYGELEAALRHLDTGMKHSQDKSEFVLEQADDMRKKILLELNEHD